MGSLLRNCLSIIPKKYVIHIMQGPIKGMRWIVGSQTHGMWLGSYEFDKQNIIKHSLRTGHIFYDIGANVGFYSLLASRYIGITGSVIAFEPLPRNIEYLYRHIHLNKLTNVKIIPNALSDHSGKEFFSYTNDPSACHISSEGNIEVIVTTLDELIKKESIPPPNIIKVDIEGAEISFLIGAADTLIVYRPLIFMAIHSQQLFGLLFDTIVKYKLPYNIKNMRGDTLTNREFIDEVLLEPL